MVNEIISLDEAREILDDLEPHVKEYALTLATIRDKRLWEQGDYKSFADFCERDRGWSRGRGTQVANYGRNIDLFLEIGVAIGNTPSERQSRILDKYAAGRDSLKKRIWEAATADGPCTADDLEYHGERLTRTPEQREREEEEEVQQARTSQRAASPTESDKPRTRPPATSWDKKRASVLAKLRRTQRDMAFAANDMAACGDEADDVCEELADIEAKAHNLAIKIESRHWSDQAAPSSAPPESIRRRGGLSFASPSKN